jgi:hypothetical protein
MNSERFSGKIWVILIQIYFQNPDIEKGVKEYYKWDCKTFKMSVTIIFQLAETIYLHTY